MRDVGKNESKVKIQGVNKMDTAANSQSQKWKEKLETWKKVDLGRVNGVEKITVVDV